MTENTTTKNERRTAEQHEANTKTIKTATTANTRKPVRKEKPADNGNGKIKATEFSGNKKVIEAIIKGKKLDEKEAASVRYFVNYVINEYNRGITIQNI
jgi:hypothetical protein